MHAPEVEVAAFLRRCQEVVDREGLDVWDNAKNRRWMDETGYVAADAEDIVRALATEHYARGPEPDDNPARSGGEVWVFGLEWQGFDLYVKVKLETPALKGRPAVCMSMHEREWPLVHPYRRRR